MKPHINFAVLSMRLSCEPKFNYSIQHPLAMPYANTCIAMLPLRDLAYLERDFRAKESAYFAAKERYEKRADAKRLMVEQVRCKCITRHVGQVHRYMWYVWTLMSAV